MAVEQYTLWKNQEFEIAQCRDCAIPGYLIVSAVEAAKRLSEWDSQLAAGLGITLVRAASAVEAVIRPLKLYCAQFGETGSQAHFHVFPRTPEITHAYLKEYPSQQALIHGPVLLDWARSKYKDGILTGAAWQLVERIRDKLLLLSE